MYDMQDVIFRLQCLQEEFLDASGKDQMQWNNAEANPSMAPEFLEVGLSVPAVATFVTPGNVTVQAEERGAVIHVRDNEGAAMIQLKLAGCIAVEAQQYGWLEVRGRHLNFINNAHGLTSLLDQVSALSMLRDAMETSLP